MTDVRSEAMREKELHVVGDVSTGMRGKGGDAMGTGESEWLLRRCEETPWREGAAGAGRRRKTAMGIALTVAGWFWIGYFVGLVLIVLEVWR